MTTRVGGFIVAALAVAILTQHAVFSTQQPMPVECRWETTPFGWDREYLHTDRALSIRRTADAPAVAVPPGKTAWTDLMALGGRPEPGQTWLLDHQPVVFKGPPSAATPPVRLTTRVIGSPDPPPPYRAVRVYPGYRPSFPIMVRPVPGTDQMLTITENGPYGATTLVRLPDRPDGTDKEAVKLLAFPGVAYDLAFHPQFAKTGFVYVGWNGQGANERHFTRITRYHLDPQTLAFDPASARLVIEWDSNGHNGGALAFAADGTLFVTSGDGTADSDVDLMGQRLDHLRAKVLRIDVDHPAAGKGYTVPADNPFVADKRFVPETWAYGLRNPWRLSFDVPSGQLWVGNNGQDQYEQVYRIEKGANYGWSLVEGGHPFYPSRKQGPHPIQKPTVEHSHAEARSLTGGFVYRGRRFPELVGAYLYGDHSTGRLWAVKVVDDRLVWQKELARTPLKITAIIPDRAGEVLICDHQPAGTGGFYTLEPSPPAPPTALPFPTRLSDTGLFADVPTHTLKPGLVPYEVNAPFWSDGLHKVRAFALPPGGTITYKRAGGWEFPDGTVLVKSFSRKPSADWIETRLLVKQQGEWAGYSYRWNTAGTDADLVAAGGDDYDLGGQVWRLPSRAECMICHTRAANFVLGLSELQANRDNQLAQWEATGLFTVDWQECVNELRDDRDKKKAVGRPAGTSKLLPKSPAMLDRLSDPFDPAVPLDRRVRSWLHSNCSACHVEAGGGNARMELGFRTATDKMRVVGVSPVHAHPELPGASLVTPGGPDRSILVRRVASLGTDRMPPIGRNRTDERAVRLLREWVASLGR